MVPSITRQQAIGQPALHGLLFGQVADGGIPPESGDPEMCRGRQLAALEIERLAAQLSTLWTQAGILHRVLKGVALAHQVYERADLRTFADLDVLVEPGRLDEAVRIVEGCGGRRLLPAMAPAFDARFGKDVTLTIGQSEIDLHRTLIGGPYSRTIDHSAIVARGTTIRLGGVDVPCLGANDLYIHAALTVGAADDPPKLANVIDLYMLDQSGRIDPPSIIATASEWRIAPAVARGVSLAAATVGGPRLQLSDWAESSHPTRRDRILLWSYQGSARSHRRAVALFAMLRVAEKVAFAKASIWPNADYLAARSLTHRTHLTRVLRKLIR